MTESKQTILSDFKEFFYVFDKEDVKEVKKLEISIPFMRCDIKWGKNPSTQKELDLIEKKRSLKRWKQSIGYYSLYPEIYKFRFKDLK
ncbi:MAG: hypothetical protein ACFE9N_15200 [Promethearchaeota archaeon]